MTETHRAPALTDPRELEPDDLVGFVNTGRGLTLAVSDVAGDDAHCDVDWLRLWNEPKETTEVWGTPVRQGSVALQFGEASWKIMPLPQVLARRRNHERRD